MDPPVDSNREAAERFVAFGLEEQARGRRESASGPGSSVCNTLPVRQLLLDAIRAFAPVSVLDLGCGDWNWMRHVMCSPEAGGLQYLGVDVHPGMISALNAEFGSTRVRFECADILAMPLPASDLVICRDVLFHMELALAARLVQRIVASGSRFLLSTTFPDEPRNGPLARYLPIEGWGFHRINLDIAPFELGARELRAVEEPGCAHQGQRRQAVLYRLQ
jgi:SAM-dependent methyltransferase